MVNIGHLVVSEEQQAWQGRNLRLLGKEREGEEGGEAFRFGLQRIISEFISVLYIRRMTIKSSFEFPFPRIGRPKKGRF